MGVPRGGVRDGGGVGEWRLTTGGRVHVDACHLVTWESQKIDGIKKKQF